MEKSRRNREYLRKIGRKNCVLEKSHVKEERVKNLGSSKNPEKHPSGKLKIAKKNVFAKRNFFGISQ